MDKYTETIRTRTDRETKASLQSIADARHLELSDICREAFREYKEKREKRKKILSCLGR